MDVAQAERLARNRRVDEAEEARRPAEQVERPVDDPLRRIEQEPSQRKQAAWGRRSEDFLQPLGTAEAAP